MRGSSRIAEDYDESGSMVARAVVALSCAVIVLALAVMAVGFYLLASASCV